MKQLLLMFSVLIWISASSASAFAQSFEALDETEQKAVADTFQYALENNPTGQSSEWENPDHASSAEVRPVRTYQNAKGEPCREFTQKIIIGDKEEIGYGTACRQPDGSWKIVTDQPSEAALAAVSPAENRTVVYINETPWPAYFLFSYGVPFGYWYPYYYPTYFSFSFSTVYYKGRYYPRAYAPSRYYYNKHYPKHHIETAPDRYRRIDPKVYRERKSYNNRYLKGDDRSGFVPYKSAPIEKQRDRSSLKDKNRTDRKTSTGAIRSDYIQEKIDRSNKREIGDALRERSSWRKELRHEKNLYKGNKGQEDRWERRRDTGRR